MERGRRVGLALLIVCALLAVGCSGIPPHPGIADSEPDFSKREVQAQLEALESIGPRRPGSKDDERARAYLEREFRLAGASVETVAEGDRRHLIAEIPGRSSDVVLFAGVYSALGAAAGPDDSGAALLLELARVLGRTTPAYTLRFALAEVHVGPIAGVPSADPSDGAREAKVFPESARDRVVEAGRSLARTLEGDAGGLARLRAVLVFDTTARPGLHFDRDLRSHPVFREIFWNSASALGRDEMFAPDAIWSSPHSLHDGFRERSMDRVLALVDERGARGEAASPERPAEASAEDLAALGSVSVEAAGRLMHRFEKVDAFSD